MKKIYTLNITKDNFVDDTITKTDESGKEIRVVEKVNQPITESYFIANPSLSVKQEGNLYYESVISDCIRKGIFTVSQLRKKFADDWGVLNKEDKKNADDLWAKYWEIRAEINKLNEEAELNKDKIEEHNKNILKILADLQSIEEKSGVQSLEEHTAEKIADNKTILWLTLKLSYKDLGNNKQELLFGSGDDLSRLKKYEEIKENEDSELSVLTDKLYLITSLWYFNRAKTKEEFDEILSMAQYKNLFNKPKEEKVKE